jgi:hypothetical protein
MKALPPPGKLALGAFASERGVHGSCGSEFGSHSSIENQGAIVSSKLCVTSFPGCAVVGSARGSLPSVSTNVTSLPDPGRDERNRIDGSSCPM